MNSGIYLKKDDGSLVEMTEQQYASEDVLQTLLADHPSLLAGNQINPAAPRKWLLVSRETLLASVQDGVGRWSVDHLFLDQDAIPTIVEVKRSSDTRIRREVVGQMLEYAANAVVYWPIEKLISQFETTNSAKGQDPSEVLADFLGEAEDANTFWERVRTNLQAGKVRLVFVADYISPELQRIVEFLNGQMSPAEVLAVQIKQYVGEGGFKTLIPRVMGQTAQAQQKKAVLGHEKKQWDEETFFKELETKHGAIVADIAKRILEWTRPRSTRVWWGKGSIVGSFVPIVNHKGIDHQLFAIWTYGSIEVYFQWYSTKAPFISEENRLVLLGKLNAIEGISLPDDSISRRPSIPLKAFQNATALDQFLEVYDWFIVQIKTS